MHVYCSRALSVVFQGLQKVLHAIEVAVVQFAQVHLVYINCDMVSVQSNLSYPDSCYPGTSLNRAADLPYFMLMLQKLWAVQWVWPIIAYVFILYSVSYGHPLIPRRPDKRGLTVLTCQNTTYMTHMVAPKLLAPIN